MPRMGFKYLKVEKKDIGLLLANTTCMSIDVMQVEYEPTKSGLYNQPTCKYFITDEETGFFELRPIPFSWDSFRIPWSVSLMDARQVFQEAV